MDDQHYLDPNAVNDGSRNYGQMLKDIWWALRTHAGSIFTAKITTYGADGLPSGDTTPEVEFAYMRQNVATLNEKLDKIIAKIGA